MRTHVSIGGIPFPVTDYDRVMATFQDWMCSRHAHQVCIVNVHTLITAMREPEFHDIMREAAMATMDGLPLTWYANAVCRAGVRDRVCGPELMWRCMWQGVERGWKHYLYGSRPDVLQALTVRVMEGAPGVQIVGSHSPPFRKMTEAEELEDVARINASGADILWVGLGAPRQEQWIYRNLHRLTVPVCVGVGAAFDFHAGSIRRAPARMQALGLEWLYRVYADPRLFRRYLDTNPPFLWMLIRDWVRVRLLRQVDRCCRDDAR